VSEQNNPGIFLIQPNGELVEMNEGPPESEAQLQRWLEKYPRLLAGHQIDPDEPRRWLLIERECGVPSEEGRGGWWAMDHLFLDQDAIPTIVEVKRKTNTEIRRQVVGQMLDYAANAVVYWPVSYMRERFTATCRDCGLDPEERLINFLGEDNDPEEFWREADRNLRTGKVRLIFVADEIPRELQRVVEFLNEQMDRIEVLALEVKQYISDGQAGLVPRVIGQTAEAQARKLNGPARPKQDEESFFQVLAKNRSPEEAEVARTILAWSKQHFSDIRWGLATFVPVLNYDAQYSHNPISISMKKGLKGGVKIRFARMKSENGFTDEQLLELLRMLNAIKGIHLPPDITSKTTGISLSVLENSTALEQFEKAIGWTISKK
jgi:hypothetical protein